MLNTSTFLSSDSVYVRGAELNNKGAHLMLRAVRAALPPDVTNISVPFRIARTSEAKDEKVLRAIRFEGANREFFNSLVDGAAGIVPESVLRAFSFASYVRSKAVLDASGFAYSDQRSIGALERVALADAQNRAAGRKVIYLPQAFGPFETGGSRDAIKRVIEVADVIFARDADSYKYLVDAAGESANMRIAPDFTNLLAARPGLQTLPARALAIVPNRNMIDKSSKKGGPDYLSVITTIAKLAKTNGFSPYVLVHDAKMDMQLGRALAAAVTPNLPLIHSDDPSELKGYLAGSAAVIGSRFHALVGALASGTPSISLGWSHKYGQLMNDYACRDHDLTLSDLLKIESVITGWSDDAERQRQRTALLEKSAALKEQSKVMWRVVRQVLGMRETL